MHLDEENEEEDEDEDDDEDDNEDDDNTTMVLLLSVSISYHTFDIASNAGTVRFALVSVKVNNAYREAIDLRRLRIH